MTFPSSSTTRIFLTRTFLLFSRRLAQAADDFVEVLIALQTLDPERDAGHDRLFLLDDHARVGADLAQVEVVLHTEGQPEHQRQQQEQPGAEALYLCGKLHAKTKKNISASDVRQSGKDDALDIYLYFKVSSK